MSSDITEKKATILLVDDEPGMRETLKDILVDEGYEVTIFASGKEAVKEIRKGLFDIVMVDLKLPDVGGIEVMEEAKEVNPESAVIVMTGYASLESAVDALNRGAFSYIIKPFNMDEVKVVIKKAVHQIRLFKENQNLIDELQLTRRKLEKAVKELENASQIKSHFLASMSHELRTPINAIIGFTDFLLEDHTLNTAQKSDVERISINAQNLLRLIDEILDLSRIEAGKTRLVKEIVDIVPLVRKVIDTLRLAAEKKRIKIENQMSSPFPRVFVDPNRIMQVLANLVSNAIKYTKEGGKITLSAEEKGDALAISVADTGIGIPPQYLDKIFERFERVPLKSTPGVTGVGLGLTISKELLNLHHGKIWVESEVDKGSKFSFSLLVYRDKELFQEYLKEMVQEATRDGSALFLVIMNIEDIYSLKEKYGTQVIDELQDELKDSLKSSIREPLDKIFKYAEGILIFVLTGKSEEDADAVKKRIEELTLKHEFKTKDITPSFKFRSVTYPADGHTVEELIKKASTIEVQSSKGTEAQSKQ